MGLDVYWLPEAHDDSDGISSGGWLMLRGVSSTVVVGVDEEGSTRKSVVRGLRGVAMGDAAAGVL